MLIYCAKQKKQTACVPGSETFVVTKNGRNGMKCQCAECGATKFRSIKGKNGDGLGDILGSFTKGLLKSGTDQYTKVYDTAPQYQFYRLLVPQEGGAVDIHKAIGKLPKPKAGWTLPGHKYTGPYNDLENQVRYNPKTGEILEVYDAPTGKTDAIAMQHDVDYSVCGDDKKWKHIADRKMVKSLDAVPWNERQWGHWLARNAINTKRKVGFTNREITT